MAVGFRIPLPLREHAGHRARLALATRPRTVGEALEALWKIHPDLRDRIVTETGEVRTHVNLFVGSRNIRWSGGLATPVPADAEIWILPAVSGG
jgi:molybdopterin converting factor small subunit